MSRARGRVLQDSIGIGWATYLRLGNIRMFYGLGRKYQEQTHAELVAALARGDLFVAYLSTFPSWSINHAILIYASKPVATATMEHYLAYDPNHPEAPRELTWSSADRAFAYQQERAFVGGCVRLSRVVGKTVR